MPRTGSSRSASLPPTAMLRSKWNYIDGFSESVVQYIHEMEST